MTEIIADLVAEAERELQRVRGSLRGTRRAFPGLDVGIVRTVPSPETVGAQPDLANGAGQVIVHRDERPPRRPQGVLREPPRPGGVSFATTNNGGMASMAANRYGIALVVTGPSGAGKSTVCRRLRGMLPNLHFSVSCTTRRPRPGEVDGVDYRFVSRAEYEAYRVADAFVEHAEVHGNGYGTLRSEIEPFLEASGDVLLDIDVEGARQVRRQARGTWLGRCLVDVFFAPPSFAELERRLRRRGTESEAVMARRLAHARRELEAWNEFAYVVINDEVETATLRLLSIVQAARCAVGRVALDGVPTG